MKGRHIAAGLCVALAHVVLILLLLDWKLIEPAPRAEFESEVITLDLPLAEEQPPPVAAQLPPFSARDLQAPEALPDESAPDEAATKPATPPGRVDWPIEARKSATRVLAAEAEAERVAKLFSGPQGTWASLTKRQRSQLKKFKWKAGVDGLEYDEKGNAIYHLSDGCVLVNFAFIACALGKAKVNGELFKDMREYLDELRLPQMNEGNGTEPEALRPAN